MTSKDKLNIIESNNNIFHNLKIKNLAKNNEINKDKSNDKKNWLNKIRKSKQNNKILNNFQMDFNMEGIGTIEFAKYHRSANRPLKKIKDFDQNTKFCPCCSLPVEQKGYIEKFKFCGNTDEFIQCGSGISLYFSFLRFSIFILILTLLSMCFPTIYFTYTYTNQLMNKCIEIYEKEGKNINNTFHDCINYIGIEEISTYFINGSDWALRFNGIKLKEYISLYKSLNKNENINKIVINYSFIYFIGLITLFIINLIYIILLYNINKRNDMKITTPGDYTVIISNLNYAFKIFWRRINKINNIIKSNQNIDNDERKGKEERIFSSLIEELGLEEFSNKKEINILEGFNTFIKNKICISSAGEKYKVCQINICYKIKELKKIEDKIQEKKSKIIKINHDPKQRIKNEKLQLKDDERKYFYYPINIYGIDLCTLNKCEKAIQITNLELEQNILQNNLNNLIEQSKNLENFSGTIFVTFLTKNEQEKFLKSYPKNFIMFLIKSIKNLKYYLCGCFIHKDKRKRFFLKRNMVVDPAPEPEEIQFENLQITYYERFGRTLLIYLISIIMIGISFIVISSLNKLQQKTKNKEYNNSILMKYGVSLIITFVISIINIILEICLEILTKIERHITMTNYYLSFSIKLTLFTFINSSVIPLVSNYRYNNKDYDLLVTNMLLMFLTNSFVTPILWTLNFNFFLKLIIQFIFEKKKVHNCTQKDLNNLYELPNMKISYKYSYLSKTLLMSFLYIPIFPIGIFISLLGFILAYFLEKYNFVYMYKRPEMLNSNLCEFYSNFFVINFFMLGIGNYIFIRDINEKNVWPLVNINLFAILIIIPYNQFLSFDCIGIKESELKNTQSYEDLYFTFSNDYERTNPMTKKEGMKHFLYKLKEKGYINNIDEAILKSINNINLMEIYYKTKQNYNNSLIQKSFIHTEKNNITYNNFLKKFSSGNLFNRLISKNINLENSKFGEENNINGYNGYNFDGQNYEQNTNRNNKKENSLNKEKENNLISSSLSNKIIRNQNNNYNSMNSYNNINSNIHINTNYIQQNNRYENNNSYNDNNNIYINSNKNDLPNYEENLPQNIPFENKIQFKENQDLILNQYINPFHLMGFVDIFNPNYQINNYKNEELNQKLQKQNDNSDNSQNEDYHKKKKKKRNVINIDNNESIQSEHKDI